MSAYLARVLAKSYNSGGLLHLQDSNYDLCLYLLHFNKEQQVAFGVVVGEQSVLPMGAIVKITVSEGCVHAETATQEQLRAAERVLEQTLRLGSLN